MKKETVVKFKKMSPTATIPRAQNPGDIGFDICADEDASIIPGTTKKISTNLQLADFDAEAGMFIKIEGRSGMASKGIFPVGGIVDPSYRGEIAVVLTYNQRFGDNYEIRRGDRIAQLVFYKVGTGSTMSLEETNEVTQTNRNDAGFGSSGR